GIPKVVPGRVFADHPQPGRRGERTAAGLPRRPPGLARAARHPSLDRRGAPAGRRAAGETLTRRSREDRTEMREVANERIDRLRDAFLAARYDADGVLRALGPQAHAALGRNEPVPALRATRDAGPLGTLIRLFLLGQAEEPQAVAQALHPLPIEEALTAGLLVPSGDELRAGLDVRPHGVGDESWWVISDLDSDLSGQPVRQDHVLGVGQATLSLVRATPRR